MNLSFGHRLRFPAFARCWWSGILGCLGCLLGVGAQASSFQVLPADHPYRAVLERWESAPPERRESILDLAEAAADPSATPARGLSEPDRQWLAQLGSALTEVARSRSPSVWPLVPNAQVPDDPRQATLPYIGPILGLTRAMQVYAGQASAEDGMATAIGLAHLGRHLLTAPFFIGQLAGAAVEQRAANVVATRINDFTPDQLQRIGDAWGALPPPPDREEVWNNERQFFKYLVARYLRPGLRSCLESTSQTGGQSATDDGTLPDLRLSALINGSGERIIGLEDHRKQTSFFLRVGETVDGVTLVAIDFPRQRAYLRVCGREATLDLSSKRLIATPPVSREELIQFFPHSDDHDPERRRKAEEWVEAILEKIRAHPQGLDGYLTDLQNKYDQLIWSGRLAAENPRFEGVPTPVVDDPLLWQMAVFTQLTRRFNQNDLTGPMVRAGVAQRRAVLLGESREPDLDPWGEPGQRLQWAKTAEGGFLLRSVYEVRPGGGSTFRFGQPESGWVKP